MLAEVQTKGNISGAANFQPELSCSSKQHQHTESEQIAVYGNVFLKSHPLYEDNFLCDASTKTSHMLLYFYILYLPSLCSASQQSTEVVKWKGNLHV